MSCSFHLGLTGWPLDHSLSPRLHQAALEACELDGEYHLFPIPPLPEGEAALKDLVQRLRQGALQGLNVTIPHKRSVLPLVDRLTPTAQAVGAVNTLIRSGGQIVGENTDAAGFWDDLQAKAVDQSAGRMLSSGTALVLGAGGAARAAVYALSKHGWQVYLAARRLEQAQQAALDLGRFAAAPTVLPWPAAGTDTSPAELRFTLLVNATPVGMHPNIRHSPWPEHLPIPADCWVYDMVYNPPETPLLRLARQQELTAINGWGMLVRQAALAFLLWTRLPQGKLAQVQEAMFGCGLP
ncbi:MAG: shikimate dehydrogenase [Anaerolineales bacterium]|jgi:shikimate dehydrogenase|nr:shikimate dehydrogenase [Anaerolineales bacterium]